MKIGLLFISFILVSKAGMITGLKQTFDKAGYYSVMASGSLADVEHYALGPYLTALAYIILLGPDAPVTGQYFNQRKTTIYAGSTEIQKNIIAKLVLGL